MIKRVSAILFLVAIMPALLGVHVVHHVCHLSNHHHHVDLELLAGIQETTYCNSPDEHCCHSEEGSESHDCSGCQSEYVVLDAVKQSIVTKIEFNWHPAELAVFCTSVLPMDFLGDDYSIPPVLDARSFCDADWQSFSGVFLC